MTTCVDFYKKWEKNPNWCKKSQRSVQEIERYQNLLKELEEMGVLKERVILALPRSTAQPLMEISDPEKQKEAISEVANALNRKTPTGGNYKKKLTKPDVDKIVEKVSPPEIKKTIPASTSGSYQPGDLTRTNLPPQPSLAAQQTAKEPEFFNLSAPADLAKIRREQMEALAEELLLYYSPTIQTAVAEIMREHPSYKVKDVFYFGVQALAEKKKP